jgi:hypothetical protein
MYKSMTALATCLLLLSSASIARSQTLDSATGNAQSLGDIEPRSIQHYFPTQGQVRSPGANSASFNQFNDPTITRTDPLLNINPNSDLVIQSQQVGPNTYPQDDIRGQDRVQVRVQLTE